jgi:ribosomal protein S18 acetylase RimI-like enzyme
MRVKSKFNINSFEILCRTCETSDRNFILNLFKNTIFKYISKYYDPNIKMFDERFYSDYKEKKILLRGSRRIGMFQLSERNNRLAITGLFLSESYQGKGIAKYLMNYFEEIAKLKNYSEIELLVWDNNPAKNFYKKLGYKTESKKDHKYLMVKSLK